MGKAAFLLMSYARWMGWGWDGMLGFCFWCEVACCVWVIFGAQLSSFNSVTEFDGDKKY